MSRISRLISKLDQPFEYFGLVSLAALVVIVTWQVFSRAVLATTPFWSEEISLVLLVWVGFIGIALGFREKRHIAVGLLVRKLPEAAQKWIHKFTDVLTLLFGLFLVIFGWRWTVMTYASTMPATQLPNSTLYVILPITGVMICIYAVLQMFGIETQKYQEDQEEDSDTATKGQLE